MLFLMEKEKKILKNKMKIYQKKEAPISSTEKKISLI